MLTATTYMLKNHTIDLQENEPPDLIMVVCVYVCAHNLMGVGTRACK